LGLKRPADKGITLEKGVGLPEDGPESFQVERLKVATDIEDDVAWIVTESLDLPAGSEVVVHTVTFTGTGLPAIVKHDGLKFAYKLWKEPTESLHQRAFTNAGGTSKDYQTARFSFIHTDTPGI